MPRQYLCAWLVIMIVMVAGRSTYAQEPVSGELATANALFAEGRRLAVDGQFSEACAKFEASMRLAPRLGVQLNLADCYEHAGRTASAWVVFGEAAALARRLGDPRQQLARQRQGALVPRLVRLRIAIPRPPIADLAVSRDGMRLDPSVYGVAVPVDPGVHTIAVTAPGRVAWSTQVVVSADAELATVAIPALARAAGPVTAVPTASAEAPGRRRFTRASWIAVGASAAGIGAGTGLALAARSLWQAARSDCDASNNCTAAGYALAERSKRDGTLATVAFAIGSAALVTGIVLYLRAPRDRGRSVQIVPAAGPTAAGVSLVGAF